MIPAIKNALNQFEVNIFVVDDNSSDGTTCAAKTAGAIVISRNAKSGLGSAIRNGVETALKRGADVIVQMDADWQHIPNEIVKLINPIIRNESDFVVGCRRFHGRINGDGLSMSRRLVSEAAFMWARHLLGLPLKDPTSGFRAFREPGAKAVLSTKENGYAFQIEAIQNVERMGLHVMEVPIRFNHRLYGCSKFSLKEASGYLRLFLKSVNNGIPMERRSSKFRRLSNDG